MSETERLQKIVQMQEKELRRLRRLLGVARIANAEYSGEGDKLHITVTCIGVDEYLFIERAKLELQAIAEAIVQARVTLAGPPKDSITGEELTGGVSPEP